MSLRVVHVFGHATVQAVSYNHRRKFGVPQGGAFDPFALAWANALAGNDGTAAGLELAMCRISLIAGADVVMSWSGGPLTLRVNGSLIQAAALLAPGDQIEVEMPETGARRWLAFAGGLVAKPDGEHLRAGDVLLLQNPTSPKLNQAEEPTSEAGPFRVIPERSEFAQLFANEYKVRMDSSRVGIRLDGPRMRHKLELPSEPAVTGVIQITPEGLPIILGPDGPTIGGYPRAGVVASVDWPRLAQLRTGDPIRFKRITVAAAQQLKLAQEQTHHDALRMLRGG